MSPKRKLTLVGLAFTVALGTLLAVWKQNQPRPVLLWSEVSSGAYHDAHALETELRRVIVSVDFQEKPFSDCLDWLREKIATELDRDDIRFEVSPKLVSDAPISLRLTEAPITEHLRYITSLNHGRYRLEDFQTVSIRPLSDPEILEIGWFRETGLYFPEQAPTTSPVDVRSELENAGVSFEHGGFAEYDPKENLLKVLNTRDQLQLVATYFDSYHDHDYEPTWKDQIHAWWWMLKCSWESEETSEGPVDSTLPDPTDPFGK